MEKIERERKFLVRDDGWRSVERGVELRQAYLSTDPERTVRVRVGADRAWLTIKGRSRGAARAELEYEVPLDDAAQLFSLATGSVVEKRRHEVEHQGAVWVVDEFSGANAGLVLAEIEIADERRLERAVRARPDWVGREVTDDHRFSNSALAERPWSEWSAAERGEALGR
jgi:adenylate cyclase